MTDYAALFEFLYPREAEALKRAGLTERVAEQLGEEVERALKNYAPEQVDAAVAETVEFLCANAEALREYPRFAAYTATGYLINVLCAFIDPEFSEVTIGGVPVDRRPLHARMLELVRERRDALNHAEPAARFRAIVHIRRELDRDPWPELMRLADDLGVWDACAAYLLREHLEKRIREWGVNLRFVEDVVGEADSFAAEWLPDLSRRAVREVALRVAERYAPIEPWRRRRLLQEVE